MEAADYYKVRLEQTFEHTLTVTKTIYLIDGALLALLYFVIDKLRNWPTQNGMEIGILLLLSILNVIHGVFIKRQQRWYHTLDSKFAQSLGLHRITISGISTHSIFIAFYLGIAGVAFVFAVWLLRNGPLTPIS